MSSFDRINNCFDSSNRRKRSADVSRCIFSELHNPVTSPLCLDKETFKLSDSLEIESIFFCVCDSCSLKLCVSCRKLEI